MSIHGSPRWFFKIYIYYRAARPACKDFDTLWVRKVQPLRMLVWRDCLRPVFSLHDIVHWTQIVNCTIMVLFDDGQWLTIVWSVCYLCIGVLMNWNMEWILTDSQLYFLYIRRYMNKLLSYLSTVIFDDKFSFPLILSTKHVSTFCLRLYRSLKLTVLQTFYIYFRVCSFA